MTCLARRLGSNNAGYLMGRLLQMDADIADKIGIAKRTIINATLNTRFQCLNVSSRCKLT